MRTKQKNCQYCNEVALPYNCKCYDKALQSHTPTPWKVEDSPMYIGPCVLDKYGRPVARNLEKEDAAFIVRAVNSHEEMLEIVRALMTHPTLKLDTNDRVRVAKAIAKAEGGTK